MTVTLLYGRTCLGLALSDCIAHYHTCSSLKPYTSIASQFLVTYSLGIARPGPQPKLPPKDLQRLWLHLKFRCGKPCSLWDLESFGLWRPSLSRSISQSDCFLSSWRPARQTPLVKALAQSQGETPFWSPSQSLEEGITHTRGKGIRTPLQLSSWPRYLQLRLEPFSLAYTDVRMPAKLNLKFCLSICHLTLCISYYGLSILVCSVLHIVFLLKRIKGKKCKHLVVSK